MRKRDWNQSDGMNWSIRRSQLITTYGVGSLVSVGDESMMVAGLDAWPKAATEPLEEPRLQASGRELRLPPGGVESRHPGAKNRDSKVPVVRFPRWYFCLNKACSRLGEYGHLSDGGKNQCAHCGHQLVPSRFVAMCQRGHIEDFPYWHWAHQNVQGSDRSKKKHELRLISSGTTGSLAGMKVRCDTCDATESLEKIFAPKALSGVKRCGGHRPWLGDEQPRCEEPLRVSQRGASNV